VSGSKRVIIPGVSIWPQPKRARRERYKITYDTGRKDSSDKAIRKTVRASADLNVTLELATRISKRLERRRLGIISGAEHRRDEQSELPLVKHLEDYRKHLEHAGKTTKHVRQMHGYAKAMLLGNLEAPISSGRGVKKTQAPVRLSPIATHLYDVVTSRVQSQAAKVLELRSAATANRWLEAVVCFINWGVADGRWPEGLLSGLTRYVGDKRRVRRGVSLGDLERLISSTETGPVRGRLTGHQRALLYRTCLVSGMRANEARHLEVRHLVATPPHIALPARVQKNRQQRSIPIPPRLMLELLEATAAKAPAARVFDVPSDTARMLRRDLKAAGIPYTTESGVFDFHGLRHQTGSLMLLAGANPKAVQQHMRHSTFQMTMDTYAHLLEDDGHRAAALLEGLAESGAAQDVAQVRGKCRQVSSGVVAGNQKTPAKTGESEWSHGESNPDLLNAIQQTNTVNGNIDNELDKRRWNRGAQGAARHVITSRGIWPRALRPITSRQARAQREEVRQLVARATNLSPAPAARKVGGE
jgi:integrase